MNAQLAQQDNSQSTVDANAHLINTQSMEDVSLEEHAFAIRNSMKLLTDALIAPLVD
jgi:hypothetical protein